MTKLQLLLVLFIGLGSVAFICAGVFIISKQETATADMPQTKLITVETARCSEWTKFKAHLLSTCVEKNSSSSCDTKCVCTSPEGQITCLNLPMVISSRYFESGLVLVGMGIILILCVLIGLFYCNYSTTKSLCYDLFPKNTEMSKV